MDDEERKRQLARKRRNGKVYLWQHMVRLPHSEHFPKASYGGGGEDFYVELAPFAPWTAQYVRDLYYWHDGNTDIPAIRILV